MTRLVDLKNRYYGSPDIHNCDHYIFSDTVIKGIINSADELYADVCDQELYRSYPMWEVDEIYGDGVQFDDKDTERRYRSRMYCTLRYVSACTGVVDHVECRRMLEPHLSVLRFAGVFRMD